MRYYIDFEFDGVGGPSLTLSILRADGLALYLGFLNDDGSSIIAKDQFVLDNVVNVINSSPLLPQWVTRQQAQSLIRQFLRGDSRIVIITDWPDDISRFSELLLTTPGSMLADKEDMPRVTFEMYRVDSYPTNVPGAVQHNALFDTMALKDKLENP